MAPRAEAADVSIVIEPLNIRVDHPRHFLTRSADAFELVESVDSPNAKVLFDIYHQQITDGDVTRRLTENIDYEGYVGCEFIPQGEPSAAIDDVVRLVNDIVEPASR